MLSNFDPALLPLPPEPADPIGRYLWQVAATARAEIEETGHAQLRPETAVLHLGHPFPSAALTSEERKIVAAARGPKSLPANWCYENAQRLVLADEGGTLGYVEGFARCELDRALSHGWAAINGKVVDLTWRDEDTGRPVLGILPPGYAYYGIVVDRDYVARRLEERKRKGVAPWSLVVGDGRELPRFLAHVAEGRRRDG